MEESLHLLVGSLSHYLASQDLGRISSISSRIQPMHTFRQPFALADPFARWSCKCHLRGFAAQCHSRMLEICYSPIYSQLAGVDYVSCHFSLDFLEITIDCLLRAVAINFTCWKDGYVIVATRSVATADPTFLSKL